MKLFCLFQFVFFISVQANVYSQQTVINLEMENVSLKTVFTELGQQSGCDFLYNNQMIQQKGKVSLKVENKSLDEVLKEWLPSLGLTFSYDDNVVIIRAVADDNKKKTYIIKGQVVDEKNVPMPGVTVMLDSTQVGTATDTAGRFVLPLPKEKGYLVFSFIGFKTQKVAYTADKLLVVKMQEDISGLDEVQVVAYGSQKKRTVISAISSVKGDDLKELPTHSLENLLQGHMAGVEVNNISGSPGGGGAIVAIRGYNSLFVDGEGSDRGYGTPLYVIDGIPMQSFTSAVTGANTLSDLDPSMIESIEVLKDAASAAIYGSRAGNGVILITTKKGHAGRAQFNANVSYSASWLPKAPVQYGGSYERMYHLNALRNTVLPYKASDGEWKMPTSYEEVVNFRKSNGPMYDWFWGTAYTRQDAIVLQDSLNAFYNNSTHWYRLNYQTANVINANVQASGGNDNVRYIVGAGYYDEEGIVINTGFTRFNVISNLTAFPTKRLRMDTQLGLTYSDRSRGSNAGHGAMKIESVSADPKKTSTLLPGGGAFGESMAEKLNEVSEKNQSYSLRYNMVFDYELIRNLHLKVSAGVDYNQQNQNVFKPSILDQHTNFSTSQGTISRDLSLLNENLLTYSFSYLNKHNFNIMLGLSFQKDQSFNNKGTGKNGPNDKVHYVGTGWGGNYGLNNTGTEENPFYESAFEYESSFSEERMNSYFGRLTYNFKEKYMFETTIRRDGSSVFGEDVRWATFPAFAIGWVFSDEAFMQPFYWLSFGKIRGSWGTSGQKFGQRYLSQGLLMANGTFHGSAGIVPDIRGGVINKRLSWEETDQYDLGLDLSFFDYRLRLVVDYYYRYTTGQLNQIELPGNIYYHSFQWQNGMAVSNQGIELELEADILRNTAVKWRMKYNLSRNWNRFEKSADGFDFENQVIGKPLNQLKVYKTDGFYSSFDEVPVYYNAQREAQPLYGNAMYAVFTPGSRRILDLNGDGRIEQYVDMYYAASPLPIAHGGWINELRWKNFDLNIFFNYSLGRHVLKRYDDVALEPSKAGRPLFVDMNDVNIWNGADSKKADYPKAQYYYEQNQYSGLYDCDIENVSFIRLKQLTLGYNLHQNIAKKIGISGARVFITGENLFTLTNYSGLDPELIDPTSGKDNLNSYPLPRKFTVGLTVNF